MTDIKQSLGSGKQRTNPTFLMDSEIARQYL